jgi:amino acid permease
MSTIGSGLLSVPFAFSQVGVTVGVVTLLAVAIGAGHTAESILHCHLATGLVSYNEIAEHTFGPRMAIAVPVVVVCAIFGGCVSYVAIILSVMPTFVDIWEWEGPWGKGNERINHIFFTFLIAIFLITPLTMVKNLSSLRFSSAFGLCFSAYLVFLILEQAVQKMNSEGPHAFHQAHLMGGFSCPSGLAIAFSIFSFAYVLHLNVIPLFLELEDPSPRKMIWVIRGVVATCTTVYGLVGYAGLMLYGENTKSNVLINFGTSPAYILAKVAVCLAVVMSFPLLFFPLRVTLHDLIYMACGWKYVEPAETARSEGLLFMTLVFIAAVSVPDLGTVFSITGGTSVVILIFTAPLAFSLRLHDRGSDKRCKESIESIESIGKEALLARGEGPWEATTIDHNKAKQEQPEIAAPGGGGGVVRPETESSTWTTRYRWFWLLVTPVLGLWATAATMYRIATTKEAC